MHDNIMQSFPLALLGSLRRKRSVGSSIEALTFSAIFCGCYPLGFPSVGASDLFFAINSTTASDRLPSSSQEVWGRSRVARWRQLT